MHLKPCLINLLFGCLRCIENMLSFLCLLQHQSLCDSDVNDDLSHVAECGYTCSHFTKTRPVEATQDALPLVNVTMCLKHDIYQCTYLTVLFQICFMFCHIVLIFLIDKMENNLRNLNNAILFLQSGLRPLHSTVLCSLVQMHSVLVSFVNL